MRISDWSSDVCSSDLASWFRTSCGAGCDGAASGWTKLACTNWGSPGAYKRGRRAIGFGGVRSRKSVRVDQLYINSAITVEGSSAADKHLHQTRSEEHTSELQSLMRISYAVFCLKKKTKNTLKNNQYNSS